MEAYKLMKILMASFWDYPHIGGVSTHITELKSGLEELGHQVDVFSMTDVNCQIKKAEAQIQIHLNKIQNNFALSPFMKSYEISKAAYGLVAEYLHLDSYDIIHAHDVIAASVIGKISNKNLILTIHGYLTEESISEGSIQRDSNEEHYLRNIESEGLKYSSEIISVDTRIKKYLETNFKHKQINVMKNFLKLPIYVNDFEIANLKKELNIPLNSLVIISPRRLVEKNGVIYGVKAMLDVIKRVPHACLICFGNGPKLGEIQEFIYRNNLIFNCIMAGNLPNDIVRKYVRAADIVLIPSIPSEGVEEATSIAALEGMANGKVVIASNIGGLKELIADQQTGVLVPPFDSTKIAEVIVKMYKGIEERKRIGLNARKYIEKNHSHIMAAKKVEEVYKRNKYSQQTELKSDLSNLIKKIESGIPEVNSLISLLRQKIFQSQFHNGAYTGRQQLKNTSIKNDSIHIVYVMTHVSVTGGAKIIFQHANYLKKAGVRVSIVSNFPKPDWYPVDCDYIQVPFGVEFTKGIPTCDVIVATYWDHIISSIETGIAPVVYFEQGDFHLYDNKNVSPQIMSVIHRQYNAAEFILTVSNQTSKVITEEFNRNARVIHNALDTSVFTKEGKRYHNNHPYFLMVGSDQAKFKGIEDIISAFELLKSKKIEVDLFWITQHEPSPENKTKVTRVFVNPPHTMIAELYRGALAYVSGSRYESFPLPPLEAMSCATLVITTDNVGVLEYAKNLHNALVVPVGNIQQISDKMRMVYDDNELRCKLIENGLETSKEFSWSCIGEELKKYYSEVAKYAVVTRNNLADWDIAIAEDQFYNRAEYVKFIRFIQYTNATDVYVVADYSLFDGHITSRWERAARLKADRKERCVEKCYVKVKCSTIENLPYFEAHKLFAQEKFDEAYMHFMKMHNTEQNTDERATCLRWMILCLIEMGKDKEAIYYLQKALNLYWDHTDFYYLYLILSIINGYAVDKDRMASIIYLLGEASYYPEFFSQIDLVLKERLRAG
jgi:glycosyltransferase involved in cell wall biosynthesis